MSFTEKIVVGIFSGKVMHSDKVMPDCINSVPTHLATGNVLDHFLKCTSCRTTSLLNTTDSKAFRYFCRYFFEIEIAIFRQLPKI